MIHFVVYNMVVLKGQLRVAMVTTFGWPDECTMVWPRGVRSSADAEATVESTKIRVSNRESPTKGFQHTSKPTPLKPDCSVRHFTVVFLSHPNH